MQLLVRLLPTWPCAQSAAAWQLQHAMLQSLASAAQLLGPAVCESGFHSTTTLLQHNICLHTSSVMAAKPDLSAKGLPEVYYRRPPDAPQDDAHKQSKGQKHFTQVWLDAINEVLSRDAVLRESLVVLCGFEIHNLRVAKGREFVWLLWDCFPGKAVECERQLEKYQERMRWKAYQVVKCKILPKFVFRHNHLPPRLADLAERMEILSDVKDPAQSDPLVDYAVRKLRMQMEVQPRKRGKNR